METFYSIYSLKEKLYYSLFNTKKKQWSDIKVSLRFHDLLSCIDFCTTFLEEKENCLINKVIVDNQGRILMEEGQLAPVEGMYSVQGVFTGYRVTLTNGYVYNVGKYSDFPFQNMETIAPYSLVSEGH